jgi:hypothetical protein
MLLQIQLMEHFGEIQQMEIFIFIIMMALQLNESKLYLDQVVEVDQEIQLVLMVQFNIITMEFLMVLKLYSEITLTPD